MPYCELADVARQCQAFYTCYSIAFGGEWHVILQDLMVSGLECTPVGPGVALSDCGDYIQARFSFWWHALLVSLSPRLLLVLLCVFLDRLFFDLHQIIH